jgi:hypothetical protein
LITPYHPVPQFPKKETADKTHVYLFIALPVVNAFLAGIQFLPYSLHVLIALPSRSAPRPSEPHLHLTTLSRFSQDFRGFMENIV